MSVWAGATLYLRVVDGHREFYVPQGLSLERHPQSCWKLKNDVGGTGRSFFVNVAGLGKKWRLPDLYDPKNASFLGDAAVSELAPSRQSSRPHQTSGHRSHGDSRRSSNAGGAFDASRISAPHEAESGYLFSPAAAPPSYAPTPHDAVPPPPGDVTPAQPSLLAVLNEMEWDNSKAAGDGADAEPAPRDPNAAADGGYDDDEDWEKLSPLGRERQREKQAAREREREMEQEAEAEFIAQAEKRQYTFDFGDPEADARAAVSPERLSAQADMEVLLAQQRARTQERMEDVSRSASRMMEESRRREDAYDRERRAVEDLERQQLDVIRTSAVTATTVDAAATTAAAERVQRTIATSQGQHVLDLPRSASPASTTVDGAASVAPTTVVGVAASSPAYHERSASHGSGPQPSKHDAAVALPPLDGPGPWGLLQEQLDHHRDRAAKLQLELEERDRMILEFKLADAERERREIALRVRMVEAMAAFREREALMQEEEADARNRAVELRAASGRRARSTSSSVPRHPLYESDMPLE